MPYEIFIPINKYQGRDYTGKYEVSNLGNVRNMKTGKVLKPIKVVTNTGYTQYNVCLSDTDNKKHTEIIARLVLTTFKANPRNCSDVNHRNEDTSDNSLNNLEWTSHKDNLNYGSRNERIANKNSIPIYCITNNTVYKSATEAAKQLNLDQATITKCCKNKRSHTGGFKFEYYTEGDVQ